MTRTAAIADIHGNVHALDAVLADPRFATAERVVVLGDVVAGTFPVETLERVESLGDRALVLSGNADRLVLHGAGGEPEWARGLLGAERLGRVAAWPATFAVDVRGLGPVRCCHVLPDDDEAPLTRITPDGDFAAALSGIAEPTVVGGHTHVQFDRQVGNHRYVNVGSVGRAYEGRPGAYWALLDADVELVSTDYDVEAAAAAVLASTQPRRAEVAETLRTPPSADDATAWWEQERAAR